MQTLSVPSVKSPVGAAIAGAAVTAADEPEADVDAADDIGVAAPPAEAAAVVPAVDTALVELAPAELLLPHADRVRAVAARPATRMRLDRGLFTEFLRDVAVTREW